MIGEKPKTATRADTWQFNRIFKVSVRKFLHPLFGFEVGKFDDFIRPPQGTSLKDFLHKKYGEDSVALLRRLMDL